MLDTEELVTVRWDQVEAGPPAGKKESGISGINPRGDYEYDT